MKTRFFAVISIMIMAFSSLFCFSGCNKTSSSDMDPWDKLGGGGTAIDLEGLSSQEAQDYKIVTTLNSTADENVVVSNENKINLSNLTTLDVAPASGAYSYDSVSNVLTIKTSGVYELYGTLNGSIVVNGKKDIDGNKVNAGEVTLIMNGATINSTKSSAGILFLKEEDVRKIITVKTGTINTINTSDEYSNILEEDEEAGIQAKTCDLIINGGGTLNINANSSGDKYSGIKAKYLAIDSLNLCVNANKHGINSEFQIWIKNADISVTALGDGIKTNLEPELESDAVMYSSDKKYGYIYVENSNIEITAGSASDYQSGNHGISANNCLYIDNSDENVINITTNGGAPSTVTERLSDLVAGKALRASGVEYNGSNISATYSDNYAVVIVGGEFIINSCSDAITSKGNVIIDDGNFTISTGDDGLHAEYLTKINNGTISISKSYEGIEGATVEIYGGDISVVALDDGINAANKDLKNYSFYILIAGGNISIDAGGDGIDSNGTIKFVGGYVVVNGPASGANAALDADTGILTNGGDVVALGTDGMVETPSINSTQCFINLRTNSKINAGNRITVKNSAGDVLFDYIAIKSFQSVIISLSDFELQKTYTVVVGNTTYSATLSSIGTSIGRSSQQNIGMGGNFGRR